MIFRPLIFSVFLRYAFGIGGKGLEAQLYEDLLYDYNKIPRPVKNSTDVLMVEVGASLIRIIDVDEKNQVLTTNLWLEMNWTDAKLTWDPKKYGGIKTLHIPSDLIWIPDFVLYNNAAGDPDITIFTDALVSNDGRVYWQPPAIYKSFCPIDVTWFPYDSQECTMKFGAWSYTGYYVDLRQLPREQVRNKIDKDGSVIEYMDVGMDLSFFYRSAEWDLLSLTSERHSVLYASCCGPEKYVDITFYLVLRRKTLFFTCNLIIPCFLISILTTFVFYLSDHKITFAISILVTLTVFFLVIIDILPPTSLVIPMFGRYLITTMCLVALSTVISVITVNFRFRSGSAHKMSPWIRSIFLNCLPRILMMRRPEKRPSRCSSSSNLVDPSTLVTMPTFAYPMPLTSMNAHNKEKMDQKKKKKPRTPTYFQFPSPGSSSQINSFKEKPTTKPTSMYSSHHEGNHTAVCDTSFSSLPKNLRNVNPESRSKIDANNARKKINDIIFTNILRQVRFIAEYFRKNEEEAEVSDDWTFVAMVLDRLFLIIFSILNVFTFLIILEAPSLYDTREPLNITIPTKPLGISIPHKRFS